HDDDLGRSRLRRAADGGVDLLRVEAAALLVERAVPAGLLPLDDSGDALDVADDVDLHARRTSPTTSPRLLSTGTVPRSSPRSRNAASAGRRPRIAPSSTFSATPIPSGEAAQSSPSAPPLAIQPGRARIRSVSFAPA